MKSKTVTLSGQPTDRLLQAKFHPQTAGLIAGQMNAIRMNQAQSLQSMDSMIEHLAGIEYNTRNNEYNTRNNAYIKSIYEFLQTNSNSGSNNIRANGGY